MPSALVVFCFVHFNEKDAPPPKKKCYVLRKQKFMNFLTDCLEEKHDYIGF